MDQDIFAQRFNSLNPDTKRIVEILAYACCPISHQSLEKLSPAFKLSNTEFRLAIANLRKQSDIIRYEESFWEKYYILEPQFSLHVLLNLENQKRNIEKEIKDTYFWTKANGLGEKVRVALLEFYRKKQPFNYTFIASQNISARELIISTLHFEEFEGIEKTFPEENVGDIFFEIIHESMLYFKTNSPIRHFYERFREIHKDNAIYQDTLHTYYSHMSVILPGKLDEIPEKAHAETANGCYQKGVYHAYKEDYPLAIKYFEAGIKQKGDLMQIFPFYSYVYTISLMLEGSERSRKRIVTLSKRKILREYGIFLPTRILLAIALDAPKNELEKILIEQSYALGYPFLKTLTAIILRHYQLEFIQLPTSKLPFESFIAEENWNLLWLEGSASYPHLQQKQDTLRRQLGFSPLISRLHVTQEWEKVLRLLTIDTGTPASPTNTSRIVYLVPPSGINIQPILQQSKDGIKWSAGRNIALKKLAEGLVAEMNDTDKAVAQHIKQHRAFRGHEYSIDDQEAIVCLIGYPLVFLTSNPSIPVEIAEEKPELVIRKHNNGYTITSNIGDAFAPVIITRETPTRLKITQVTPQHQEILRVLQRVTTFPPEAKEQLLRLLKALGGTIVIHSDLIDEHEKQKTVKGDSRIIVQMLPIGDSLRAELFCKPFGTVPPYCKPGKGAKSVTGIVENEKCIATRNLEKEKQYQTTIQQKVELIADNNDGDSYIFERPESCLDILDVLRNHDDIAVIEWPEGTRYRVKHHVSFDNLHISVTGRNQWFEIEGELRVGQATLLTMHELLQANRKSEGRFIPLGEGEYIALTQELKKRLDDLDAVSQADKKNIRVQQFATSVFDGWADEGIHFKTDKRFKELQEKITAASALDVKIPALLKAELRDYQLTGFEWMARLSTWGAGGCLADDMGLGKTVQTIAMLLHVAPKGPSLVVCPASVLPNWENELTRFAPSLRVIRLNSSADRTKAIETAGEHDVVLTTYGLLVTEEESLTKNVWQMAALDEAHAIKNRDTKMSKVAMQLQAHFRLTLTGTPIQNHLGEIWNLFQFINPGLLGSLEQFTERYIVPIVQLKDKQCQARLKRLLSPFLLRRTKAAVLDELPSKTEILKEVELSEPEMACYELLRRHAEETLLNSSPGEQLKALAEITRLRLAACNVNLVSKDVPMQASKMESFLNIVEELQENGHRSLVFSQFTSHLALVRQVLDTNQIPYLYLDGSTPIRKREQLVKTFQAGETLLFLISLKAGGLGLNLTAADFVIHMDPWWNPAVEDQASDRVHRIGQTRPVTIYRLIAKGTIEEKIIRLHRTKKDLADSLLEGADLSKKLSKDEILELLRQA